MNHSPGKLVLVPTPVGNLDDMTFRGISVLKDADYILAEDTRVSIKLLKHFGIEKKMVSYHKFNEHKNTSYVVDDIQSGKIVALISDAGTPGISDPGFLLVRACVEHSLDVECLPGATALVPALAVSGLPTDRFVFEGFLPQKKGRQKRLQQLVNEDRTMVFYESPFRLVKTLMQLAEFLGDDRQGCVCREISKLFEEIKRGSLSDLKTWYEQHSPKGEIVIVVAGLSKKTGNRQDLDQEE